MTDKQTPESSLNEAEIRRAIEGKSGEVRMKCPFPDCPDKQDEPLGVNADTGKWFCHRCDKKGNIYSGGGNGGGEKPTKPEWIWQNSKPCNEHPYLAKKGVNAYGLRIDKHGNIVVPYSKNGAAATLQFIKPSGDKLFLKDHQAKGAYFQVGTGGGDAIYICEGYATAASVHEATGSPVFIVGFAGNLKPATENIARLHPGKQIVFCADNDKHDKGQQKAAEAARAVGGKVCMPEQVGHDFNDLHAASGLDAIREAIDQAAEPDQGPVIEVVSLSELSEEQHPDNPIITGLLDEKESLLICGQSGIGKSLLSLLFAASIGNPPLNGIWGKFQVPTAENVLIVQSENSRKATAKRLRAMMRYNPELQTGFSRCFIPVVRDDIRYIGAFQEAEFQDTIKRMVDATEARCIILDPLISYHGGDENDNSEMRRSLDALTELMDKTGAATIMFHHLGKASGGGDFNKIFSGRGASAIGDWAANILTLGLAEVDGPEAVIEVAHHKARNFPTVANFYLRRTADLQFQLCDKPGGGKEQAEVAAVIRALHGIGHSENQSMLVKEIQASEDWSDKKCQRAIQKAVKIGFVEQKKHPEKKQWQTYSLSFDGQVAGHQIDPENDLGAIVGTTGTDRDKK